MVGGGVFIGVALTHTIPETYAGLEHSFEDMDVKLPLAGIVIAFGYILMVVIDSIMHKSFDNEETENTENTAAEVEEKKEEEDFNVSSGSKIIMKKFQIPNEDDAADQVQTAKVSP